MAGDGEGGPGGDMPQSLLGCARPDDDRPDQRSARGAAAMRQAVEMLGVRLTPATIDDLHAEILRAVTAQEKVVLANHNFHSLYLFHHNLRLKDFYAKAHLAHID